METAGLQALFEAKIDKVPNAISREKVNIIRKFIFSSKKFGQTKQGNSRLGLCSCAEEVL